MKVHQTDMLHEILIPVIYDDLGKLGLLRSDLPEAINGDAATVTNSLQEWTSLLSDNN